MLRLIACGHSNKEIAARLGISVKTVEAHKANAMRKLDVGNRSDIVRYAYFPEGAVLSKQADMADGRTVEFGMIGGEGAAGLPWLSDARQAAHTLSVAAAGSAFRIKARDFEQELGRGGVLPISLLAYTREYVAEVAQRSGCTALHKMEQKLAVWLLMITERLGADTIEITQERMASHLGVRRAGIMVIAGELQQRGVISHSRGSLRVLRCALEAVACERYVAIRTHGRGGGGLRVAGITQADAGLFPTHPD